MASTKKKSASSKRGNNGTENNASAVKKGTSSSKSSKHGKSAQSACGAASSGRTTSKKRRRGSGRGLAVRAIGLVVIGVIIACIALFDVVTMNSVAMQPTLSKGDVVLVWAPWFVRQTPIPGAVYEIGSGTSSEAPNFLRVIACDGKEVSYREDALRVDGVSLERLKLTNDAIVRPADEPEIWREGLNDEVSWHIMLPQNPILGQVEGRLNLAEAQCFMAGDNRMSSYDSRHTGGLSVERLGGRALIILRSTKSDGLLGHLLKPI